MAELLKMGGISRLSVRSAFRAPKAVGIVNWGQRVPPSTEGGGVGERETRVEEQRDLFSVG